MSAKPSSNSFSRREALAAGLAGLATGFAGPAFAHPVEGLEILAAPTGASISLARVHASSGLAAVAPGATFRPWRDPDELRAGVVSGKARLFSSPTHVPANLFNRGLPIRLVALLGAGHLYLVTAEESPANLKDFAGKPVLGFFRHDMPDLVFRACARMEGMDADKNFKLSYVQSGMEAAQFLAAGKAETAILSEPAATAALAMAAQNGRTLRRAVSLQEIWSRHRHTQGIPMVGVAAHASLLDDAPEVLTALRQGLPDAKTWALGHPAEAGTLAETALQMRAPVFAKALPFMNLDIRSARAAKAELADFYQTLVEMAPQALAGKVPADDFYLDL